MPEKCLVSQTKQTNYAKLIKFNLIKIIAVFVLDSKSGTNTVFRFVLHSSLVEIYENILESESICGDDDDTK